MNIPSFIEHLLHGRNPVEQYLLSLLKHELAGATPPVATVVPIGAEEVHALGEVWQVALIATRES